MPETSMSPRPPLLVAPAACLLIGTAVLIAGEPVRIVVPNSCASVEAASSAGTTPNLRSQFIFAADQFAALPPGGGYLTGFRWRPDRATSGPANLGFGQLTLRVSVTSRQPGAMSGEFALNVTGPIAVVRARAPWQGHTDNVGPPAGPRAFDIEFRFDKPFRYNPAEGNLLVEGLVESGSLPARPDRLDELDRSKAAVIVAGSVNAPTASAYVGSIVTELTFVIDAPPADFDGDRDVDGDDMTIFAACATGPAVPYNPGSLPAECTLAPEAGSIRADFDRDGDVDMDDFGQFQRCCLGPGIISHPACAD